MCHPEIADRCRLPSACIVTCKCSAAYGWHLFNCKVFLFFSPVGRSISLLWQYESMLVASFKQRGGVCRNRQQGLSSVLSRQQGSIIDGNDKVRLYETCNLPALKTDSVGRNFSYQFSSHFLWKPSRQPGLFFHCFAIKRSMIGDFPVVGVT